MPITDALLDIARDGKRALDAPPGDPIGRMQLLRSYARVRALAVRGGPAGEVEILGLRVRYLDPANLLQLFKEIFVGRLYAIPLDTKAPYIVDCGSNIGMSILYFKLRFPDARIVAFEPGPVTFPTLRANVDNNRLRDVTLHQRALSDAPGMVDFYVRAHEPGALNMGMYAGGATTAIQVQADRLSDYIDQPVDLLKLDIEGAEELVLADLLERGKLSLIRNIVCEYHHHLGSAPDHLSRTLRMLEDAGFGYQLDAYCHHSCRRHSQQDVLIYAYRQG